MGKIIISKPKGLADKMSQAHCYQLSKRESIQIITAKIITKNQEAEIIETNFSLIFNPAREVPFGDIRMLGDKNDEDCLAALGYYLADWDEQEEAKKIRRLVDIGKFL